VVLSGRPATTQFILDVDIPGKRTIEDLYTPKAIEMLATLRQQIQVAQGRAAQTPDVTAPNASAKSAASGMIR
jgi:NitT/TauT family transport system ATP-binding protein